jgi:hypothetical protein
MNTLARPVILATGALLLVGHLAAMVLLAKPGGRVVFGDATHHFVQLRSLVYDRDLHFGNEYRRIYQIEEAVPGTEWVFTELTSTGHVRNYMPVGPALLWAPLYLLVSALQLAASWVGLARPPDGFDRLLQIVPGVTGVMAATGAALVTWRSVRAETSDLAATIAVLAMWLGSHAIYYSLVSPSYSHAASMLTGAWFFAAWLGTRQEMSLYRAATLGALAGLCALMRWQDAVFLLVPLIEILRWREPSVRRAAALAAAGAAFVVVFSPQMAVWTVLYGQPLAIPQGPSFMQWTNPQLAAVLLSDNHGLLSWAPILTLALTGLAVALFKTPTWRLPLASVLLVSWYVNAAVADWWAGEAFGARRFLSLFPLFTLGVAVWLNRPARTVNLWYARVAALGLFTALNGLLLLQYQIYMKGLPDLAAYPKGWFDLYVERFLVPWRVVEWLLR